jgi:hypothetical protein
MENLLDEALSLDPAKYGIWLDTEPLLRMDIGKQADVEQKLVQGKIKTPDEARKRFNLAPTGGGDTLWGQAQDYPLGYLAMRNDLAAVSVTDPVPAGDSSNDQTSSDSAKMLLLALQKRFAA